MLTLLIASIQIHFHFIRLKLHEISLYLEFPPEEFIPPYLMRLQPLKPCSRVELNPTHIEALMICIQSTHALLDAFLSLDTPTLRCIPVIAYTRMFYAIVILTKMALCAHNLSSSIGAVLDLASLKISFYLNVVANALQTAVGQEAFGVPSTFLSIIIRLTAWYQRQQSMQRTDGKAEELFEPMAYLRTNYDSESPSKSIAEPPEALPPDETQSSIRFGGDSQTFAFSVPSENAAPSPGTSSWSSALYPLEASAGVYNFALQHDQWQTYGVKNGQSTQDGIPWSHQTMDFGLYSSMTGQAFESSYVSFPSENGGGFGS
jgi:hypothetical protein